MKIRAKRTAKMQCQSMSAWMITAMTLAIQIHFEQQLEKTLQKRGHIRQFQLQWMLDGRIIAKNNFVVFNTQMHSEMKKWECWKHPKFKGLGGRRTKYFVLNQSGKRTTKIQADQANKEPPWKKIPKKSQLWQQNRKWTYLITEKYRQAW